MRDDTEQLLRSGGRRMGHARRRVLDALGFQVGPVTADDLATALPDVHVSSVYRTLAVLEELGIVRHVHLAHGPALYELSDRVVTLRHLVCEVCGRTVEVPASAFAALNDLVEREHGFVLDSGHFALPGRCVGCIRPPAG
jgi:Fur family ferric uptake transcriptional regulator